MHTEAHELLSEVQTIVILSTRKPDTLLINLIDLVLPHSATSHMIKAVRGLDLLKKKKTFMGQGQQGTEVETGQFSSFNLSHMD